MERVEQIFKHPAHLKILLLFHKNKELVTNLIKIVKTINVSRVTVRRVINDLVDAKVLEDLHTRSRVITVANTTQAQLVFEFIEKINRRSFWDKYKVEPFSKLEIAEAEIRQLHKIVDVLREECERKKGPTKIKEAIQRCHFSPHYKLVYKALQASDGKMQGMYQEYCTLCKSKNIKPLVENSMASYIGVLVREGKLIRMEGGGRYSISKEQVRVVEERSRR